MEGRERRGEQRGRRAREQSAPPSLFLLALSSSLSKVGIGYEVPFRCNPWINRGEGSSVRSVQLVVVRAEGRANPSHSEVSKAASIRAARECSCGGSSGRVARGWNRGRPSARASVGSGACDEVIFCGARGVRLAQNDIRRVGSVAAVSTGKTEACPRADVYVVRVRGRARASASAHEGQEGRWESPLFFSFASAPPNYTSCNECYLPPSLASRVGRIRRGKSRAN